LRPLSACSEPPATEISLSWNIDLDHSQPALQIAKYLEKGPPATAGSTVMRQPASKEKDMITASWRLILVAVALAVVAACKTTPSPSPVQVTGRPKAQITVLYDAFGKDRAMQKDWGYAALVEYGNKRILFDTGNNPDILARNAKAKGIDLAALDFVVMSHRHGDHMGGLTYLLSVNPHVKIFAPKEGFGVYGADLPSSFYRKDAALPPDERYFDGTPPETMRFGSAWPKANFQLVDKTTEIASGIHLISLVSDKPGTLELRELSLAIDTPDGMVVVVGCSHPGIEKIIEAAAKINPRIQLVAGGFHLVVAKDEEIARISSTLHDTFRVAYVAPGHCTGEPTFAALRKVFGDHYLYAGLGTSISLGPRPSAIAGSAPPENGMGRFDLESYRALLTKSDEQTDALFPDVH
jgi:7,8-dihydropterin-6-yl-methyl-4-(beta-D-ribofuranosyl)aminobenzene 5'-phosphate synthase